LLVLPAHFIGDQVAEVCANGHPGAARDRPSIEGPEFPARAQRARRRHRSRSLASSTRAPLPDLVFPSARRDTFERASSKSLFAEDEINAPVVETWLKETLETPLAHVRPRLVAADPRALEEPRFFRAAVLMLWLQGFRSSSVGETEDRRRLEDLAQMPIEHLDAMVQMIGRDYTLRLVFTVWQNRQFFPLSVPSEGTFLVKVNDPGCASGFSLGVGLPLDPRCALVALPVEERGTLDLSLLRPSLANYSVGISPSRRVVLHPQVRQSIPEDQLRRDLHELRENNDVLTKSIHDIRNLIAKGFAMAGIVVARDRVGRIIQPR